MQGMHPYSGVGASEISIIDLDTGVVVPQPCVRNGHLDYGYESIVVAQTAFVEFFHMLEWYVQTAPVSSAKEGGDHVFPCSMFRGSGRMITVIGTEEYVPGLVSAFGQCRLDGILLMIANHEQGRLTVRWRVFYFATVEKTGRFVPGSIHLDRPLDRVRVAFSSVLLVDL